MCEKKGKERGSQVDIQWSVNYNNKEFEKSILELNSEWKGGDIVFYSPCEETCFKEYSSLITGKLTPECPSFWDEMGVSCPKDMMDHSFWPNREAHWDALAVLKYGPDKSNRKLLLFEAKAHLGELCSSKNPKDWSEDSRIIIEKSISTVWKEIAPEKEMKDWLRSYQFANRITYAKHLVASGVPTCVIYVLYTNDYSFYDYAPDSINWENKLAKEYNMMGLSINASNIADVYKILYQEAPSANELYDKGLISLDVKKKYTHKK